MERSRGICNSTGAWYWSMLAPRSRRSLPRWCAPAAALPQAPQFTLERLIALTRRVCLVIAGDTGPLHLACALGKPVVGIYGPTDPSRNGPFGVPFRVLRHPESKRDHTRHEDPEAGLLTITPQQVVEAANDLLQKTNDGVQQSPTGAPCWLAGAE